ncbi:MAG: hypothetical protein HKN12_08475, partial [Gemmatimonadetes bacterium]|nr:hypothetical protein [Gemmatimonadota bacterium]
MKRLPVQRTLAAVLGATALSALPAMTLPATAGSTATDGSTATAGSAAPGFPRATADRLARVVDAWHDAGLFDGAVL